MKRKYIRHFLFCFVLLALLLVMSWRKPQAVFVRGLAAYGFVLASVFSGRLTIRIWHVQQNRKLAATSVLLLLLILSFASAFFWGKLFNHDGYFHSELLSISIPAVLLLMVIGAGLHFAGMILNSKENIQRASVEDKAPRTYVLLKTAGKMYKLEYNDLLYAEANRNYTKVVTVHQTINTPLSFTSFEKLLPPLQFIRVHRSFIINKSQFSHIEGNRVFIGKHEIPIGESYKEAFLLLIASS
jgi:hypothetical protein